MQISPVRINLSKHTPITAFTITNTTKKDVLLQTGLMKWRQLGAKYEYKASQDLIIAPPIASIAAGKTQLFRVAIRSLKPDEKEKSYRLYLQEVIPQSTQKKAGLHFAMRIGLPVFIAPLSPQKKQLHWSVVKKKNKIFITANNKGNTHVQVSHLLLADKDNNKSIIDKNVFKYILPGKSYTWQFATKNKADSFMKSIKLSQLTAKTDSGDVNSDITIS